MEYQIDKYFEAVRLLKFAYKKGSTIKKMKARIMLAETAAAGKAYYNAIARQELLLEEAKNLLRRGNRTSDKMLASAYKSQAFKRMNKARHALKVLNFAGV